MQHNIKKNMLYEYVMFNGVSSTRDFIGMKGNAYALPLCLGRMRFK